MPIDDGVHRWILRRPQPNARLCLFCFSHAGGMPDSYLPWKAALGPAIEVSAVQLPGREQRYRETPCSTCVTCLAATVRADFALVHDYQYRPGVGLNVPLTVLAGRADREVPVDQVPAWEAESSAATEVLWFDGDHFFVSSASEIRAGVLARTAAAPG